MNTITIITETPKGSSLKYKYDEASGLFKVKKLLPAGMFFPYDFGFIPGTRGEDGDPLDVLVIAEFGTFTGCSIECRLIGGIKATQAEKKKKAVRNDRFLVVPKASLLFKNTRSMAGLPPQLINELKQFFVNYNQTEGKTFSPLGLLDVKASLKLIHATGI